MASGRPFSVVTLLHRAQICHEFTRFSARLKVKVANFYGGVPVTKNKEELKASMPNIVVGTPGRIKQVLKIKKKCAGCPLWHAPCSAADAFRIGFKP